MTIEQLDKVDIVGVKPGTRIVRLVISDHLTWDDVERHAILLQEKINAYIAYVASGQMARKPDVRIPDDPEVTIVLASLHEPPPRARVELDRFREFLAGIGFGWEVEPCSPIVAEQVALCARVGAVVDPVRDSLMIGIADDVVPGAKPINGLRHPPVGNTTGWYLWAREGDPSREDDYFKPMHVAHLDARCPGLMKFLGLPPGWRFLTDLQGSEDVWEDVSLLEE